MKPDRKIERIDVDSPKIHFKLTCLLEWAGTMPYIYVCVALKNC